MSSDSAASTYLPIDRRIELAGGSPVPEECRGACLVADVAGFTPLARRLADDLGPRRGAEELSKLLEQAFDALIRCVHDHRGAVVGFSGDAITCWLEGDDGSRAARCGLAMCDAIAPFAENDLGVKVSLSAGSGRRLLLGDPEIQRLEAVIGAPVDNAYAIQDASERGEVTVDLVTLDAIASRCASVERREGLGCITGEVQCDPFEPWPESPALTAEQTKAWLLPAIEERLASGQGEFLTELRRVTSIFISFEGIDADASRFDAYVRYAQRVLSEVDGVVIDVTRDDKGTYLNAALGAPVSHEDDADRALTAALALREPPAELDFVRDIRIGIAQGRARTGAQGGKQRRTYTLNGTNVNLAARLMGAAEAGQVLVSQAVVDAATAHEFESLGVRTLKGSGEIAIFQARGRRRAASGPEGVHANARLVGRDAECALIDDALKALLEQRQSAILVFEAEAGTGKSRLISEVWRRVEAHRVRPLLGTGDAVAGAAPYRAWREVLATILDLDLASLSPDGLREALAAADPAFVEWAPLFGDVLGLSMPEDETTAQLHGQARANRTNDQVVALLKRQSESAPLVLVFDDAHWIDSSSWALLRYALFEVEPMLVVIGTRPMEDPPSEYFFVLDRPDCVHQLLGPLDAEASIQLVAQRLAVDHLPEAVADFVRERAEGHPLFSEQLAYALRDAGWIEVVDGQVRVTVDELGELDFPDTVESVITSRIDQLPAPLQLTVKVASAIGRLFAYDTLRDVHPFDLAGAALRGELDQLSRLDITPRERVEPDLAYLFKHIITQQVTYELMPFEQRRDLHRAIALWYEARHANDLTPYLPLLAHHWAGAENAERAIACYEGAGAQALRSFANREVVKFLGEALRLAETEAGRPHAPVERRASWQRQIGEAWYGLGDMEHSRDALLASVALLGFPKPGRMLLPSLIGMMFSQLFSWKPRNEPEPQRYLEASKAYDIACLAHFMAGELGESLYAVYRSLDLAQRAGVAAIGTSELARSQGNVAASYSNVLHLYGPADRLHEQARENAERSGRLDALGSVLQVRALHHVKIAQWEEATALLDEAIDVHERLGNRRRLGESIFLRAHLAANEGDMEMAVMLARQLMHHAQVGDDLQNELIGRAHLALFLMAVDQLDEALGLANESVAFLPDEGFASERLLLRAVQALARLRVGDRDGALFAFRDAVRAIPSADWTTHAREGFIAVADVASGLAHGADDPTEFRDALATAQKSLHKIARLGPSGASIVQSWRYRGILARVDGKTRAARNGLERSLELAKRYRLPSDEGRALFELGRYDEARVIFETNEYHYLARRCDEAPRP